MYTRDMEPKLAVCGHTLPSLEETAAFACELRGHAAIDLSLVPNDLASVVPRTEKLRALCSDADLEIRYHLPLGYREIGHADPAEAGLALEWMLDAVSQVALAGGTMLTLHAGLPSDASRERVAATGERLRDVVAHGADLGVAVCLENLRWGLTSDPMAFMDLIAASGAAVTLDLGHAASSDFAAHGFGAEEFARLVSPLVRNAHVYEREVERHFAPIDLTALAPALDVLLQAPRCDWWVVELHEAADAWRTRAMLAEFLDTAPVRLAV